MKVVKEVLKAMRDRTHKGVPFRMEFLTHNKTEGICKGVKVVQRAALRSGYNADQSNKSELLIAYTDLDTGKPGFFYAPLLIKYNYKLICNIEI